MALEDSRKAKDLLSKAKEDIDKMHAERKSRDVANIEAAKILAKRPSPTDDPQTTSHKDGKKFTDRGR
jgi:hypothetical protein